MVQRIRRENVDHSACIALGISVMEGARRRADFQVAHAIRMKVFESLSGNTSDRVASSDGAMKNIEHDETLGEGTAAALEDLQLIT
eukprot:scaffold230705_cov39-Tisochrysis_lutea.AAC.2